MTLVANLSLALVVVLTLCVIPVWQSTTGPSSGPDGSAVVINPIICGARWFFLSIALAACASRGAFSKATAAGIIAIYFIYEMIAAFCMAGQAFGLPEILSKATIIIPFGLPIPLAMYAFWRLNVREVSQGSAMWATTAIALLGIAAGIGGALSADRHRNDRAYLLEQEMRWYRTITSLGDIEPVLRFMSPETFPEVRALAIADLAKRPNLVAEFEKVFADGGVTDGAGAARYLKEMKSAPPELGVPYVNFANRTLALIQNSLNETEFKNYSGHAEAVVIGAEALHTHAVDRQIREMNSVLAHFHDR